MHILRQYFEHIEPTSALIGFCVGALLCVFAFILFLGKSKRELLIAHMHLQQAVENSEFQETLNRQTSLEKDSLLRENNLLSRENAGLEAQLQGLQAVVAERDYL